ncbi:protein ROOT INITIATION DEFECTIVE 3-like [Vitis riparia]|uniref:Uncharacterized protein n=1 Tax=Vitis vinifera TaxID=29760 RepID=E0CS13_VITVI|eukprot:XP_019072999.1 PREDICTED: protein ROOT INITIATION DEFECTIVE 3 [Vitis vinifera]
MASFLPEIVLTSSPDGPIIAYDPYSGAIIAHFTGSRSPPKGLTLAGKGLIAASHISATGAGSINLYNWWSSAVFNHLPLPEPVAPLAATLDGAYLFAGGLSGHIYSISLPSGKTIQTFPAHSKSVSCLEINDDGSLLISGSDDGSIVVAPIFQLVATSPDGTCKFWSLPQGLLLRTVALPCPMAGLAIDPTESHFYAAGSDGSIYIGATKSPTRQLTKRNLQVIKWREKHGGPVVSLAMLNQGRNLVSGSEDGNVWIWEVEKGQVMTVLGNEMVSISDLVMARGVANSRGSSSNLGINMEEWREKSGLAARELSRPVRKMEEMKEKLGVAVKDRSRAIDILESAIGAYERLLELILKEAKGGTGNKSGGKEKESM